MANGFGDLKPQQGAAPTSQPGLDELLQQARIRQAQQFAQGPSEGEKLMDIGEQIAAGYRGGKDFSQVRQLQSQRDLAQDQALQQFLSHQDNLSMQQQQERRLTLQHMHQKAMDEGNHAAQVMQQITGNNPKDIAELSAWWASKLQAAGTDDDDFDPMQVRSALAEEYTKGINEGRYEGPTEVLSERDKLGLQSDIATEAATVAHGRNKELMNIEYAHKADLERIKAVDGGKPVNVVLPPELGGITVVTYDGTTYVDPQDKVRKDLPASFIIPSKDTAWDVAQAARQNANIADELRKHGINPETGVAGVGQLHGKFNPEIRTMFKALTDNPGIGPWSKLQAGLDKVIGGAGIPEVLGYKTSTMFPDTEKNRNHIRLARQFGKSAFILSDKFPTYEQKLVEDFFPSPEEFFANPDTEVVVLADMHDRMLERKVFHLQEAYNAVDPKIRSTHMKMVTNIGAFIRMIGSPEPGVIRRLNLGGGLPHPELSSVTISNVEEYNEFINNPDYPSGTPYTDPDGVARVKR